MSPRGGARPGGGRPPIDGGRSARLSVRVPEDLFNSAKGKAIAEQISMAELTIEALQDRLTHTRHPTTEESEAVAALIQAGHKVVFCKKCGKPTPRRKRFICDSCNSKPKRKTS